MFAGLLGYLDVDFDDAAPVAAMTCTMPVSLSNLDANDFEIIDNIQVPPQDTNKTTANAKLISPTTPKKTNQASIDFRTRDEHNNNNNKGMFSPKPTLNLASPASTLTRSSSFEYANEKLLGFRVELKWSSGRWYRGTICEYNEAEKRHKVLYDDGDRRWYHLPEMVFRFVKEEDEWIDLNGEGEHGTKV